MYKNKLLVIVLVLQSGLASTALAKCNSQPPTKKDIVTIFGESIDCNEYNPSVPVQPGEWITFKKRESDKVCFGQAGASFSDSDTIESTRIITQADVNALLRKLMPEKSYRQLWEARTVTKGPGEVKTLRFTYIQIFPTVGKDNEWTESYKDECIELTAGRPEQLARAMFTSIATLHWK